MELLEELGVSFVCVDEPAGFPSSMPPVVAVTSDLAVVRFHGRNAATWNIRGARASWERFDWLYSAHELAEWIGSLAGLADEADEVYALFNTNKGAQAPQGAAILRGLLDDAGLAAAGAEEPAPATLF